MIISTISVMAISVSLLVSTVTVANSILLEQYVYAIDNCDPTSTCTNTQTGTGNNQENNCIKSSTCSNAATGNENKQNNRCESVRPRGQIGCINIGEGDGNTQKNDCNSVGEFCRNFAIANDNTQTTRCKSVNLPASIFQMAMTILKTTIVTQ